MSLLHLYSVSGQQVQDSKQSHNNLIEACGVAALEMKGKCSEITISIVFSGRC